jgi:hypothetical protein
MSRVVGIGEICPRWQEGLTSAPPAPTWFRFQRCRAGRYSIPYDEYDYIHSPGLSRGVHIEHFGAKIPSRTF